jgi:hypothetical protein
LIHSIDLSRVGASKANVIEYPKPNTLTTQILLRYNPLFGICNSEGHIMGFAIRNRKQFEFAKKPVLNLP